MHKNKLDEYEEDIEKNLFKNKPMSIKEQNKWKKLLVTAAKSHAENKKLISLRISREDLKAKAAKQGLPYQTYINMLIYKDVVEQSMIST